MSTEERLLPLDNGDSETRRFPSSVTRFCDAFPRRFKVAGICLFITLNVIITGILILIARQQNLRLLDLQYSHPFTNGDVTENIASDVSHTKLHVIIPASHSDENLCKLILGLSLLGYPNPTLLSWGSTFSDPDLLAGGSHLAKVSGALAYLDSLGPGGAQDDDLVLMLDAYDIHLQLPRSVLVSRYFATRAAAQQQQQQQQGLADHGAGSGARAQPLVLFGAGKRCAPNLPHSVACYAVPDSPLPADLYGANTDTVVGHNQWSSARQRYLNSGYVLGTAGAVRRVFAEAWRRIQEAGEEGGGTRVEEGDDGSRWASSNAYHGSDQSVFADMYGRQEWAREKLRLLEDAPAGARPRTSQILGTAIDNVLSPSFAHEEFDPAGLSSAGNPYEFGIYLDFWSHLGHQTINSEWDARWVVYGGGGDGDGDDGNETRSSVEEQVGGGRTVFDCPVRVPAALPDDILDSRVPTESSDDSVSSSPPPDGPSPWLTRPLYTHLCLSQIPVFRHMNGPKEHREWDWPRMWYQPHARAMLRDLRGSLESQEPTGNRTWDEHKADPGLKVAGGAWTDRGDLLKWEDLCPSDYEQEIFRDIESNE